MIRTLLIDDERLAREELKKLLKDFHEIEIIDEAKNPEEALDKVKTLKPDLLFLDIQMPGMSGFDMLKQLDEIPQVVFVTAFDEYALKAFEMDDLDYILKPVDPKRLEETVKKVIQNQETDFQQSSIFKSVRSERFLNIHDSVFIKDNEKCYFVNLQDVRYFESDGNYVKVFFERNKPLILRSLNSLEERLDPEIFFRANRKHIVNTYWINKIENWFNGGLLLELKPLLDSTGKVDESRQLEKIEISRRQTSRFKELFSL